MFLQFSKKSCVIDLLSPSQSLELNNKQYDSYVFYGLGEFGQYQVTIHSYTTAGDNLTDYAQNCSTASSCECANV